MNLSRRTFLGVAASVAGGSWRAVEPTMAGGEPLTMATDIPRARVIRTKCPQVVSGADVHRQVLAEMLAETLTSLTETNTPPEAWRRILRPDDVIGLKFNSSGRQAIGTTATLAGVLVTSIVNAGWHPAQIVCIEGPPEAERGQETAQARPGFSSMVTDFGSGSDQLASVLDQITALISVPFLKTHNIAGMTCALKNLSHGLVKHPARYHADGCSPYIADIVAAEPIRSKLRLCLVDAIRVVFDGGPEPTAATIHNEGALLASTDLVATDAVGLAVLNEIRRERELAPVARRAEDLGYLAAAHQRGLGIGLWHGIDVIDRWP